MKSSVFRYNIILENEKGKFRRQGLLRRLQSIQAEFMALVWWNCILKQFDKTNLKIWTFERLLKCPHPIMFLTDLQTSFSIYKNSAEKKLAEIRNEE